MAYYNIVKNTSYVSGAVRDFQNSKNLSASACNATITLESGNTYTFNRLYATTTATNQQNVSFSFGNTTPHISTAEKPVVYICLSKGGQGSYDLTTLQKLTNGEYLLHNGSYQGYYNTIDFYMDQICSNHSYSSYLLSTNTFTFFIMPYDVDDTKTTTSYNITTTLSNVTATTTIPETIEENTEFSYTFNANDNYIIDTATCNIGTVIISDDKSNVVISGTATENIIINVNAVEKPKVYYTITANIENVSTTDTIPETIEENTEFSYTYTATEGYTITNYSATGATITRTLDGKSVTITGTATQNISFTVKAYEYFTFKQSYPTLTINSDNGQTSYKSGDTFTINYNITDNYISTYIISSIDATYGNITIAENGLTATITGTVIGDNVITVHTTKNIHIHITGNIQNATCNYKDGDILEKDKIPTITARVNYTFTATYIYYEGTTAKNITKSDDNTVLTIPNFWDSETDIYLSDDYTANKITETLSEIVHIYTPTVAELTQLAKKRFYSQSNSETGILQYYDYANYIVRIYMLPVELDSAIVDETKSNIITGYYDTEVEANTVIFDNYNIDLGTITVPEKYKNVYDYLNTDCILHIPFFNPINIKNEYVIGQSISIIYIVNLYTGVVTANIYSTFNNNLVVSYSTNIALSIPYIEEGNNRIVQNISSVFVNTITTAYIEVVRNIPYYSENIEGKETVDFEQIGKITGFCKVTETKLETSATNEEKEEIIDLLNKGVFINE